MSRVTPTSCVPLCQQLNSVLKYWLVQPYVFCILPVLCTLRYGTTVLLLDGCGVLNMLQEQKKKEQKKSSLIKLWVFLSFSFFFCDAAKPKEGLNWLRAAVTLDIHPQMISQVLAAPLSIHQTCQPAAPQVRRHCRHGPPQHRLDEFVELTTRAETRAAPTLSSLGHLVFVLISLLF